MNLRGTYKKSYFREINKQLIVIGLIFLTAVVIGTYLNKIWPDYQGNIANSINSIVEYYSSKILIKFHLKNALNLGFPAASCLLFIHLTSMVNQSIAHRALKKAFHF